MLSTTVVQHCPGAKTSGTNRRAEFSPEGNRHLRQLSGTGNWGRMKVFHLKLPNARLLKGVSLSIGI